MMPGNRLARTFVIVIVVFVIIGLVMSAVGTAFLY
jgi:preprotein translocase subunit SecG